LIVGQLEILKLENSEPSEFEITKLSNYVNHLIARELAGNFSIGDSSRCEVSRDSDESKEIVTGSDVGGF
jgi:hypothetical protein